MLQASEGYGKEGEVGAFFFRFVQIRLHAAEVESVFLRSLDRPQYWEAGPTQGQNWQFLAATPPPPHYCATLLGLTKTLTYGQKSVFS